MKKINPNSPLPLLLFVSVLFACANPEVDPVNTRYDDNMDMDSPSDIDPAGTNEFTFAFMGDTHVGSHGSVFRSAVEDSAAAGDEFVLVGGDLTNNGEKGQFNQFRNIFSDNNHSYRAAIGNHDIYFGGWKNFKNKIGRSIYSFDADNVHIVVLDTANGTFGQRQLEWLDRDLKNTNKEHKVVIAHYPPWVGNFSSIFKLGSEEEAAYFKYIMYKRRVNLMLASHYHGYRKKKIGFTTYIVSGGANDLIDPGEFKHYVRIRVRGDKITTKLIAL